MGLRGMAADARRRRWLVFDLIALPLRQYRNAAWVETGSLLRWHALCEVLQRSVSCLVGRWIRNVVVVGYGDDKSFIQEGVERVLRAARLVTRHLG